MKKKSGRARQAILRSLDSAVLSLLALISREYAQHVHIMLHALYQRLVKSEVGLFHPTMPSCISVALTSQWAQTMASSHAWVSINILIPKVSIEYSEMEPSAMDCTVPSHLMLKRLTIIRANTGW